MENAQTPRPASAYDIEIMARTIYGEARGETLAGMFGVAFVILHRAALAQAYVRQHRKPHPLYGDGSIASACRARAQFSCWTAGDPNLLPLRAVTLDNPDFQYSNHVALAAILRQQDDALPRATHYFNPSIVKPPSWETGVPAHDGNPATPPALFLASLGAHRFYQVPA